MSAARPAPPRQWGSHRLDARWAERVVAASGVQPGDLVLDLGAGAGALVRPLAARGARVVAVELHAGRASRLRQAVRDLPGVIVVEEDLITVGLPGRPFAVVANPPYAVSAALVRRITARGSPLVRADLVLPRWQVRRYVADPPKGYGAELGLHVPASAFRPSPRSDSAVLMLRRHRRPSRSRIPARP